MYKIISVSYQSSSNSCAINPIGLLLASNTAILFSGILSIVILLAFTRIIIKTPADNLVFGTPASNSTNPDDTEEECYLVLGMLGPFQN